MAKEKYWRKLERCKMEGIESRKGKRYIFAQAEI